MTNHSEVEGLVEFRAKKQELKNWLYGTVYKGYDQEEEAETVQQDVEDHFTDEWFINLITSHGTKEREVVKTAIDKALLTKEQYAELAKGWGAEGSDRYEGYIQGAMDVNGRVFWELAGIGIAPSLGSAPQTDVTKN